MAAAKKIGILTGGGDVPGLNPVIKSVVYRGSEMGREVVGIRRGWEGLTNMNPKLDHDPAYILPLTRENTRTIDRTGGTMLHTSRTNPRRIAQSKLPEHLSADEVKQIPFDGKHYDLTSLVLRNLETAGNRSADRDWRRRHAELRVGVAFQGFSAGGDSEDHG